MRPLIFSMGFNYYDRIWARCIDTHRAYAERIGADYLFVGRAEPTPLVMEAAWLKIPLLMSALAAGREWVLFVDADAAFSSRAPDFRIEAEEGKDVYMAAGVTGRVNSGVIMVRNTPSAFDLFLTILANAGKKLPPEDVVGWGENGEVIHFSKNYSNLKYLPQSWNNNYDINLSDNIRHYSAGKMRAQYVFNESEVEAEASMLQWKKSNKRRHDAGNSKFYLRFYKDLAFLFDEAVQAHSEFAPLDLVALVQKKKAESAAVTGA
jgi:hypothetical protein